MMYRDQDMSDLIDENARLKKELSECRGMRQHWEEQAHRAQMNGLAEHEEWRLASQRLSATQFERDEAINHWNALGSALDAIAGVLGVHRPYESTDDIEAAARHAHESERRALEGERHIAVVMDEHVAELREQLVSAHAMMLKLIEVASGITEAYSAHLDRRHPR